MLEELLAVYTEIVKAANDEQIPQHLANLVQDAAAVAAAVKAVIEQAKARAQQ